MVESVANASKCFLCDEVSDEVVWRENGFEGRLCRCGMVYTNRKNHDVLVDPTVEHHKDEFYSLPAELKARWVARNCPAGRLLEVGCGKGFFLAAARAHGYDVWGIEPDATRARQLAQHFGSKIETALLEDSRLPYSSFDVVYHCDLLAHFSDPISQLNRMVSLLRPGGVLCFEVGTLGGISPIWYQLIGEIGLGQHLWLYSDQALKTLLEKSDLNIEKITYFGLAPEVIGGRLFGGACNRIVRPVLKMTARLKVLPQATFAEQLEWTALNILRYRVGRFAPKIGSQTMFVVARPKAYAASS